MNQRVSAIAIIALCCIAAITEAARYRDGDFMTMARSRRTPHGVVRMRGYVGVRNSNGYPMAFAGGYAGARTQSSPSYAVPEDQEDDSKCVSQEPEQEAVMTEEEDPEQQDDVEQEEDPAPEPAPIVPPKKPSRARPTRPAKPTRPQKPVSEEEEEDFAPPPSFGNNKGRGGATAIATSYSNGKGAVANSHAIAYDGDFTGGQFKHKG